MYDKLKFPYTVNALGVRRLGQCGRVVGMDGAKTVKKLQEGKPGGGRTTQIKVARWCRIGPEESRCEKQRGMNVDRTEWTPVMTGAKVKREKEDYEENCWRLFPPQ